MRPNPLPWRLPRVGLALRRHPPVQRGLALALALAIGLVVQSAQSSAHRARAGWGDTTTVVVASRDLEPGEPLDGATSTERWPVALVPDHAVRSVEAGARVTTSVFDGEVLDHRRVAPSGLTALAARVPGGLRAMAIPVEPGTAPALEVGDHVDVLVALAEDDGRGPPGFTLVPEALVVAVAEDAVTVAVSPDAAPRIAVALARGAVSLAVLGAGG